MGHDRGEAVDSVKNRSNDDGHLLEDGVGSEQEGVLLGPAFDELLVLVELLKSIEVGDINVELVLSALFGVLGISDDADL